jgi:hypothetical protein
MPNIRVQSQRAREMFPVVERFQNSNLTQKAFCKTEGLALSTLQYWISRYKKYHQRDSGPSEAFVEVKPPSQIPSSDTAIVLSYPNGVTLTLDKGVELTFLRDLITL